MRKQVASILKKPLGRNTYESSDYKMIAALSAVLVLTLCVCGCTTSEESAAGEVKSAVSAKESGKETTNSEIGAASPSTSDDVLPNEPTAESETEMKQEGVSVERLVLVSDGQIVPVTFENNEATKALVGLAPVELNMRDINGNEKFATLDQPLPSSSYAPGRIEAGDLMLYGDDGIVLFYESFNSPYSYTRLGRVTDASALVAIAGAASINVAFELH